MSKKGLFIVFAVTATLLLAGCCPRQSKQPVPQGPIYGQAGSSSKLGKTGTVHYHHHYHYHKHSHSVRSY